MLEIQLLFEFSYLAKNKLILIAGDDRNCVRMAQKSKFVNMLSL